MASSRVLSQFNNFIENAVPCMEECLLELQEVDSHQDVLYRLESVLDVAEELVHFGCTELQQFIVLLDRATFLLRTGGTQRAGVGRPRKYVDVDAVQELLGMNFSLTSIARMFKVSRSTLTHAWGIKARESYTDISDADLEATMKELTATRPNTGYKMMRGILLSKGIKLTFARMKQAMRSVDPEGIERRLRGNRAVYRREYFVRYSNELWHLDTNLKLRRWKLVIRGCIDGKSRTGIYLEIDNNNTAEGNLKAFQVGVQRYGTPLRCRSDAGSENVLIARFMLSVRGIDRGSHIVGSSVHNQRIERHWVDSSVQCSNFFKHLFLSLEEDGLLNPENDVHIFALHFVFIPRINEFLEEFRQGWNSHPISTESYKSPGQLMIMHMMPEFYDISLTMDVEDIGLDNEGDLSALRDQGIREPIVIDYEPSEDQIQMLREVNPLGRSESHGYDIYIDVLRILQAI